MTTDRHSREEQRGVARGREERGGGGQTQGHKTMDARLTTLCSSLSEDTLINPCHNILLFCHFSRRGKLSRVESSRVESSGEAAAAAAVANAAAVADASSFLNLQRNNSKYIR